METAFSYDTIPYPSKIFPQTNPDRMAVMAKLFGMNPPAVDASRVLELGCGNGSNLLAQAFIFPKASFVGVDLSETHIAQANEAARELDLTNIEFHQIDVMQMNAAAFGKFDYIIAHGLFSWIPEAVREKVLEIYREMLAASGVGYVSYNAFPGSHQREMVRNMMRYHTRQFADAEEKVGKAISFLAFLCENSTEREVFQPILEKEFRRHLEHGTADIFHDDLAENYQPFYFYEFVNLLNKHDLQFLSESEIAAMSMHSFSKDVQEMISSLENIVEREQYLDFLRGRVFRQTLVCHKEIELNREIQPPKLNEFFISSPIRPLNEKPDLTAGKVEKFVGRKGAGVEIDHPLTKAALKYLGEIWGNTVYFPELLEKSRQILEAEGFTTDDWEAQTNATTNVLWQMYYSAGLIELYVNQPQISTVAGEKPSVNKLARRQIKHGSNISTLLGMSIKIEDEISRHLIELMDGTRNRAALLEEMNEFVENSDEMPDKQEFLNNLPYWLEQNISYSARMGLFSG
jgi:methyltransferase-like protein/ubiquinone/menaquinone biosynthesis C-methylase UbiE